MRGFVSSWQCFRPFVLTPDIRLLVGSVRVHGREGVVVDVIQYFRSNEPSGAPRQEKVRIMSILIVSVEGEAEVA